MRGVGGSSRFRDAILDNLLAFTERPEWCELEVSGSVLSTPLTSPDNRCGAGTGRPQCPASSSPPSSPRWPHTGQTVCRTAAC